MDIFRSRRFWSAIIGIVAMLITAYVPELRTHIEEIVPGILGIIGLLIGGYAIEDAIEARKVTPPQEPPAVG